MNKPTILMCALLAFSLAGCADDGVSKNDVRDAVNASEREAAIVLAERLAEMREAAFKNGFEEAKLFYNPPQTVNANRTDKGTLDIEPGTHRAFSVNSTRTGNLSYELVLYAGPRIDVLVLLAADYSSGYDANHTYEPCTDWDATSVKRTCRITGGEWIIVLDNRIGGGASPGTGDDEVARLRFTFEATQPKGA